MTTWTITITMSVEVVDEAALLHASYAENAPTLQRRTGRARDMGEAFMKQDVGFALQSLIGLPPLPREAGLRFLRGQLRASPAQVQP